MNHEQFLIAVQARAGDDEEAAREAARQTLEVFGELLTKPDQEALAEALPEPLSEALLARQPGETYGLDEFYSRVEVDDDQSTGFQLEHAQAVLGALADLVDHETRQRLHQHLPEEYRPLLEPRDIPEHDGSEHHDSWSESRKLSTARDGSEDRISESAGDAHTDSVAMNDDPHGDRKMSSGKEETNEGHDLATGKPDPEPKE